MAKVRLVCNWCDEGTLYERFSRMYDDSEEDGLFAKPGERHDWTCIINSANCKVHTPVNRTVGVIMEPSWINRRFISDMYNRCAHIISHMKGFNDNKFVFHPGLLPLHIGYHDQSINLRNILSTEYKKTKSLSTCISYNKRNSTKSCLYRQRTEFIEHLLRTGTDIDVFGNNWEHCGEFNGDKRIKGTVSDKLEALSDYKFSIAIENCVEEGYFTEKLTDCIATQTVPIYHGCPNIGSYFDNRRILELSNLQPERAQEIAEFTTNDKNYIVCDRECLKNRYNLSSVIDKYIQLQTQ